MGSTGPGGNCACCRQRLQKPIRTPRTRRASCMQAVVQPEGQHYHTSLLHDQAQSGRAVCIVRRTRYQMSYPHDLLLSIGCPLHMSYVAPVIPVQGLVEPACFVMVINNSSMYQTWHATACVCGTTPAPFSLLLFQHPSSSIDHTVPRHTLKIGCAQCVTTGVSTYAS